MAVPVTKWQPVKLPVGPSPVTPEQLYWRSFKSHLQIPSPASYAVTHISSPPPQSNALSASSPSECFAVTTGTRVEIFSTRTRALLKTISRFTEVAHSGEIRRDGRLLLAGDETGTIQVFDLGSRAILKTWNEHKQPVWTTKFSPTELTTLMSTSDDKTVRLWDLLSSNAVNTFIGHEDYVRSGSFLPSTLSSSNLLVSGSYDATVRIWDPRTTGRSVMTFKHAALIESVLPLPSGTTLLASSDNKISVLDLVAGKPLRIIQNHQKTVTSLCLASNATRVVSGGLDGHVKVFETSGWNVVAGSKYPSPILSVAIVSSGQSREDRHLVVGMQSGLLSIRTRLSGQQKERERAREVQMKAMIEGTADQLEKKNAKKRGKGWEKRFRGREFMGEGADIIIEGNERGKKKKFTPWEVSLREGKYAQALDQVLEKSKSPMDILTVLVALKHRSATRKALRDRDEATLQPILKWLNKYIADPRYVSTAVDVGLLVLDLYAANMGQSADIDELIKRLHGRVRKEVQRSEEASQVIGMLNMLLIDR